MSYAYMWSQVRLLVDAVHMYIQLYLCVQVHVYICTYIMHSKTNKTKIYIYKYIIYICIYDYICIYVYGYIFIYMHVFMYICSRP